MLSQLNILPGDNFEGLVNEVEEDNDDSHHEKEDRCRTYNKIAPRNLLILTGRVADVEVIDLDRGHLQIESLFSLHLIEDQSGLFGTHILRLEQPFEQIQVVFLEVELLEVFVLQLEGLGAVSIPTFLIDKIGGVLGRRDFAEVLVVGWVLH